MCIRWGLCVCVRGGVGGGACIGWGDVQMCNVYVVV